MMIRHFSIFSLLVIILFLSNITAFSQTTVGKYGKYQITLDEFESAYTKNVGGRDIAEADSFQNYKDFMELYIKFKMKLRNAVVRGFDKNPALEQELKDYQVQVGKSYIIEKNIIQPGVKKQYERRKEELRISHIMIRPGEGGDEEALQKANTILDSIKNGASFEEMAKKYSEDQFSGPKGGDIYYVTAGFLPSEFEDAMYSLKEGEVYPAPVKTNYGQHLIKVTKRQKRIPKVKGSHILISYSNDKGVSDSAGAKLTADSVLAQLKDGVDFATLAEKYSDDTGTKSKGGDLGFFERRQMVQEFDEVAFGLNEGEISDLVQTNFGYHIIKLVEKQQYPTYTEDYENLKKMYQKQRYNSDYANYITSIKNKYNYTLNEQTVELIVNNCDSSRFGIDYANPDAIAGKELFSYDGTVVSAEEFITKTNSNNDFAGKPIFNTDEVMKAVDKLIEDKLTSLDAMNLDKENKDFAALMDEYRNGIYIFKLQEDEVWNKLKVDSVKVYSYWEKNKENYTWSDRIAFGEIFSKSDSLIRLYHGMLGEGANFDSLAALYTERQNKKRDRGRYEMQNVNTSEISKLANTFDKIDEFSEPVAISGGYSIFFIYDKEPAGLKTFDEARAEVSGVVQEMESKRLEKEFITNLEKIYEPVIYYDELHKAFKQAE
jgi:peptidyl-prolyl cis-trans isomerase SurA